MRNLTVLNELPYMLDRVKECFRTLGAEAFRVVDMPPSQTDRQFPRRPHWPAPRLRIHLFGAMLNHSCDLNLRPGGHLFGDEGYCLDLTLAAQRPGLPAGKAFCALPVG